MKWSMKQAEISVRSLWMHIQSLWTAIQRLRTAVCNLRTEISFLPFEGFCHASGMETALAL